MKHLRKIIPLCLLILVLVVGITLLTPTAHAATSGDFEYTVTNGTATITCYTGLANELVIPDTLGGYPVTAIGQMAFYGCHNLTSVTIGDSVTTVGGLAFSDCSSLTAIWVDAQNPNYSSDKCGVLFNKDKTALIQAPGAIQTYTIPDSVTIISRYAFYECTNLQSITIPDGVTTIEEHAFCWCVNLQPITIGNGVTTIGHDAFYNCTSLTSVTIPDSVTTIGAWAFCDCSSLQSITIPVSVTVIESSAFAGCDCLTEVYYAGSQEQWNSISIGIRNGYLTSANIHFNSVPAAQPGDMDGNGQITNDDVILLMWNVLFPVDNPISGNADFNHDNSVDNNDVILLMWHVLFPEDNPLT